MPRLAPLVATLAALSPAPAFSQAIDTAWREHVARFAQEVVDLGITPGLGVAVSVGDRVEYAAGFGIADAAAGRAVDERTAFYIASSTKALTATAVVLQAARGEIDLEAPIDRYIPGLEFEPPLDAGRVTVADLLSMTDGIESGGPVVFRTAYSGEFTPELLVELLGGYGPDEGGRAFEYDNLPFNILGLALDPADGHGWKAVVAREVLEPLGMTETSATISTMDTTRVAMPHAIVPGGGWERIRLGKADANLHAAGGHFATPRDLARFVAAHASGGMLDGARVFPEGAIRSTHELHAEQDREFGPFHRHGWGYGWDLGTWEGRTIVHRFGSFAGYRSHMSFDPESGVGVVVLVNGGGPASPASDLVATYIYDRLSAGEDAVSLAEIQAEYAGKLDQLELRRAENDRMAAEALATRRARQASLPRPPEAYAGTYESPTLGTMIWRAADEGLVVEMGVARSAAEVHDAAKDELRVELTGGGSVVAFEFPPDGGVATALVIQGERFERVGS
ncbi:MAG TPA: serine hydrolase domain-containing protein [Gemmatimonadota bacterium]|nr:serine hydrolase domain-containing protein [Gemmatimonadota bacterium]